MHKWNGKTFRLFLTAPAVWTRMDPFEVILQLRTDYCFPAPHATAQSVANDITGHADDAKWTS